MVDGEDLTRSEAALGLGEAKADGAVGLRDEAGGRGFVAVTHTGWLIQVKSRAMASLV